MTILAKVFVTTYAVGNEQGFATGKYFDLTDFDNYDEFYTEATEYAINVLDDEDPELCFPDYDVSGILKSYVGEHGIDPIVFDIIEIQDEYDMDMVEAYLSDYYCSYKENFDEICRKAEDDYIGYYESNEEYAWEWLEGSGYLDGLPSIISGNIDIESVARDLMLDVYESNGYYFLMH